MEETFVFYCRVCGTKLLPREWRATGMFDLVTGKQEYSKFLTCPNDYKGELPVRHTIMREVGYLMEDGTINSTKCSEI